MSPERPQEPFSGGPGVGGARGAAEAPEAVTRPEDGSRDLSPGIHDIPATRYHADDLCDAPTLSAGTVKLLTRRTPRHAWYEHPRLNPAFERRDNQKFDLGNVAHELLLEGSDDRVVVVDAPDWRKKDAQAERDEARGAGLVPLLAKDFERVAGMVAAVRAQLPEWPCEPPLLADGKPERTVLWEEDGGVVCRALVDWLRDDFLAIDDLKTTAREAYAPGWSNRTLIDLGCDVQMAFYLRGLKALTGKQPEWRYIVVENEPPHELCVVCPEPGLLELGRIKVEFGLRRWRECLESGVWPGNPKVPYYAAAPAWAETAWMEFEAEVLTA